MVLLTFLLLLAGAICFLLAARKIGTPETLPLGLLFWILVPLIHAGQVAFR